MLPGDSPSTVPFDRWDSDAFAWVSPNKLEPRFSSFVHGVELFDGSVFRLNRCAEGQQSSILEIGDTNQHRAIDKATTYLNAKLPSLVQI